MDPNTRLYRRGSRLACIRLLESDSSAAKTRLPAAGSPGNVVFTSAGLAPMNCGVESTSAPSRTVKLSDRWCPSKDRPQVPFGPGSPKIVTKYRSASRVFLAAVPSSRRSSSSSSMIVTALP